MGFPRAEFGLPIIFHFKAEPGTIEPKDVRLQGGTPGRLRFASPIITKAMQIAPNKFVTLVLILNAPTVAYYGALALQFKEPFAPGRDHVSAGQITMTQADRDATRPLGGREARDAFAAFLVQEGFQLQ